MSLSFGICLVCCLSIVLQTLSQGVNSYIKCDSYSAANTASATQNYQLCQIGNVCPGVKLSIGDCSSTCSGDQYIRLFDATNTNQLAGNDDGACESPLNLCSSLEYAYSDYVAGCVSMVLRQGCYENGSCSGRIKVNLVYTTAPTYAPSVFPTAVPTLAPTVRPSFQPTVATVLGPNDNLCAAYTASNTNKANVAYATCNFQLCPGTVLVVSNCEGTCSGDQFIRLYDSGNNLVMYDDDGCSDEPYSLCSLLTYVYRSGQCQMFSLHQGCFADETCSGQMRISRLTTSAPTTKPTTEPTTLPSAQPSLYPTASPSVFPTTKPSAQPTTAKPSSTPTLAPTLMPYTGFSPININDLTITQQSIWYRSKSIGVVHNFNDCNFNLADESSCAARYPGANVMTFNINGYMETFAITTEVRAPTMSPTLYPTPGPSLAGVSSTGWVVLIHDLVEADIKINLAEVSLYYRSQQIARSSVTMQLSSTYNNDPNYDVSRCNDGDMSDSHFCHSGDADNAPWLAARTGSLPIDTVVVSNRYGCCGHRIEGATISVFNNNGLVYRSKFTAILTQYVFSLNPTSVPTTTPTFSPSVVPGTYVAPTNLPTAGPTANLQFVCPYNGRLTLDGYYCAYSGFWASGTVISTGGNLQTIYATCFANPSCVAFHSEGTQHSSVPTYSAFSRASVPFYVFYVKATVTGSLYSPSVAPTGKPTSKPTSSPV